MRHTFFTSTAALLTDVFRLTRAKPGLFRSGLAISWLRHQAQLLSQS